MIHPIITVDITFLITNIKTQLMYIIYDSETEGFDLTKKMDLLFEFRRYTGFPYYGKWGRYSKPVDFINGLPYFETDTFGVTGITLRRLDGLTDVQRDYVERYFDMIYKKVMLPDEVDSEIPIMIDFKP